MKEKLKQEYKENHEIEKELNLNEESITEEKQNNDKSKENQKIKKILKPIKNILLLIMPFILTLIIEWFYLKVNTTITVSQIIKRKTFIFSVLFIYSIYFILLGITKKNSRSITILLICSYFILLVNQIKIIYMGEPIVWSDFNFLFRIGDFVETTSTTIVQQSFDYIVAFIYLAIVFTIILLISNKNEKEINGWIKRGTCIVLGSIVIIVLFFPNAKLSKFYLNKLFDMDKRVDYRAYTTNLSFYNEYTLISGMWGVVLNNNFSEPKDYDEKELNNLLEEAREKVDNEESENKSKNWQKPNIILVFSESFWNIDQIEEISFNQKVTAGLDEIRKNGANVKLLTCSFGGLSENVSFELLTGGSMNYFSNAYIPIMSLYKRKNIVKAPSIVKSLKNNGYRSKIVYGKDYYQSEKELIKLGFDEYIEYELTDDNKKGQFVSDKYMTDGIIEELENKKDNERIFYMAATIQNHMPFTKDKYDEYDIEITRSSLDDDINEILLTYAQGAYDASKQADRLYQYIKNYDEPTMIIFLGDHLPYLYTETGKDVMDYLKYFNTSNELENLFRKYNTESYIISNYDMDFSNVPEYLSDDLLITYIANQLDIKLDDYYKWLYTTIDELPATNKYIAMDNKGKKYNINEMTQSMRNIYDIKEKMQYKFFINPK